MTPQLLPPPRPIDAIRSDWSRAEIETIFKQSFPEIIFQAQDLHRRFFDPAAIEGASLLSVKTGGCPEDCGYCAQSSRYNTGIKPTRLLEPEDVIAAARQARDAGAARFCMGAAWRGPKDRDIATICQMITGVRALGMQTCITLGMLTVSQASMLKSVGLDFYNHNVDTSAEFYDRIITTHTIQDRLDTIARVRAAGIKLCCGGIIGMGEETSDRIGMLNTLANLDPHPESVPINQWDEVAGTAVAETAQKPDPFEFIRVVATARILMPRSVIRLSAGRTAMNDEMQALCFLAGANSIFVGRRLLTTENSPPERDAALLERLGMRMSSV